MAALDDGRLTHVAATPSTPHAPLSHRGGDLLRQFSLRDKSEELERLAQEQTPLLGQLCLKGQASVWYAKPNTGKTLVAAHLISEAVKLGRIEGDDVMYVDADDTAAGVLEKQRILAPLGVHVLTPGFEGFEAKNLAGLLRTMADTDAVGSTLLVLDTMKKFVSLMDKKQSSEFANLVRQFVLKGGSFLGLAHTNKRPGANGKAEAGGTSDILDDFDCGYIIEALSQQRSASERAIKFDCVKSRGDVAQQATFAYSIQHGQSYLDLLNSVRLVEDGEATQLAKAADAASDAKVVGTIKSTIRDYGGTKESIVHSVAKECKVGRHAVREIMDRYTGSTLGEHHWDYVVADRGRQDFHLLPEPEEPDDN